MGDADRLNNCYGRIDGYVETACVSLLYAYRLTVLARAPV